MTKEFLELLLNYIQEYVDEAVKTHRSVEHWNGEMNMKAINELKSKLEAMCDGSHSDVEMFTLSGDRVV